MSYNEGMNRRHFLDPRRMAHWLAGSLEETTSTPPVDAVLLQFARSAMATTFEIVLPFDSPVSHQAAQAALDLIDQVETQLTVYRDDSEVSQVNRQAAQAPLPVEDNLFRLLTLCQALWHETEGAFDISVGALIKAWGFYRRQGRVPEDDERREVLTRVGMNRVALDPARQSVGFTTPGLEINFGSIGKGYALDRVIQLMHRDWQLRHALVHGGHSSVFAMGNEPGRRDGWSVGLKHPENPERRIGMFRLRNRGLGISAATYQHLMHQGRKLPHLLDPRIGWPAEGMLTAAVTAPSAAEADALATAFFILGADKARAYCQSRPQIGAVLLPAGPKTSLVVLGKAREEFVLSAPA